MSTEVRTDEIPNAPHTEDRFDDALCRSAYVLLRRVFRIMRGCGFSESDLRVMATDAVNEVERSPDARRSTVTARQAMMCCDVVLQWRRHCDFVDSSNGAPSILTLSGSGRSFFSLVRASVPTADPSTLLKTMIELGVVRINRDETIELLSDSVVTCSGQDGMAVAGECVLEHICGFLGSVEFNLFEKPSRSKGRFERACYANIPAELVPVLQQLVRARGQDFVDVIDEWLARRVEKAGHSAQGVLVGAGAYVFVRENFT
jgi:hypothetical protein